MNLKRLLSRGAVSVGVVALGLGAFSPAAHAAVSGSISNVTCGDGSAACPGPGNSLGYTGTVKVTAGGFPTGDLTTVHVIECEHGATDSSQCDANTDDSSVTANVAGNYSSTYSYYSLPNNALGGLSNITCDATHLCDLVVIQDDYNNFSNPHINIPVSFDTGVATPETPWLPFLPLGGVVVAGVGYLIWRKRQNEASGALAA